MPRDAWEMTQNLHKLKEKDKATFCSPSEVWSLPVPSSTKPEEAEFVVDPGASMHMRSRKDLNSAGLETLRRSRIFLLRVGQRSKKTHLNENGRQSNATRKTLYRSLSQHYQPVLPVRLQVHLLHRQRRTRPKTLRHVQQQHDVEVPHTTGKSVTRSYRHQKNQKSN